jgi:LysM repeat protein
MKVSRVVLIVVALHVLVIGGIFIFEGCSRTKAPAPDMAANESPIGEQPMAPATDMASQALPAIMTPTAPAASGLVPAAPSMTPASSIAPSAAPVTSTARSYSVKKGDSLWKIAKAEGISVGDLARANNLSKTSVLQIGQKLEIPSVAKIDTTTAAASVIPTGTPTMNGDAAMVDTSGQLYTVQSGDSLWKIARRQGTTVAALKQANSLSSDALQIGQKLRIPAAATTTVSAGLATPSPASTWMEPGSYNENGQQIHIVDIHETPAIIAKKYGIRTDDLMRANNITDATRLNYGQRLVIPLTPTVTTAAPVAPTPIVPAVSTAPALAAPVVSASQVTVQ